MKLKELRRHAKQIKKEMVVALEKKGHTVPCAGLGCNGCCRGELLVLPEEAHHITQQMDEAAWERVGALGEDFLKDPARAMCPLLDPSGACSVYENRPVVCVLYLVLTPKEQCFMFNGVQNVDTPDWCVSYLLVLLAEFKKMDLFEFARANIATTLGSYLYRAWQKRNGVPEAELSPLRNTMSVVDDDRTDRAGVEQLSRVRGADVEVQRPIHLSDRRAFLGRRRQVGDPRRKGFHYRY